VHVRQGSTLSLTCSLRAPVGPESVLVWYQDGKLIQLEQARSTISLATERSENFLSSRLLLPRASVEDGGNYTCVPSEALPVSVLVHVLNGNSSCFLLVFHQQFACPALLSKLAAISVPSLGRRSSCHQESQMFPKFSPKINIFTHKPLGSLACRPAFKQIINNHGTACGCCLFHNTRSLLLVAHYSIFLAIKKGIRSSL
jgi:Immunoglobulin domain